MAADLTADLQAAAARMGLPPLELRTPLAQRIQRGDAEELAASYVQMIAKYLAGSLDFDDDAGDFGEWSASVSLPPELSWTEPWFTDNEAIHCEARLCRDGYSEIVDVPLVVCEFLAYCAHLADSPPPLLPIPFEQRGQMSLDAWEEANYEQVDADSAYQRLRSATAEALAAHGFTHGKALANSHKRAVLRAALEAGWSEQGSFVRASGEFGRHLVPPSGGSRIQWLPSRDVAWLKRVSAKLSAAGVDVPTLPSELS